MHKNWNWLHKKWPHFTYNKEVIEHLELDFSKNTGLVLGAIKHIEGVSKNDLLIEILSEEAIKTSEIEGEVLIEKAYNLLLKKILVLLQTKRKLDLQSLAFLGWWLIYTIISINH
jgi:Fic family protein